MQATLKEKIGVDFRRYLILGACNPKLAHQALGIDLEVGTMLPCNVVVREGDGGATVVTAVDPMQTLGRPRPPLRRGGRPGARAARPGGGGGRGAPVSDLLQPLLFIGAWVALQYWILPKLGVPT